MAPDDDNAVRRIVARVLQLGRGADAAQGHRLESLHHAESPEIPMLKTPHTLSGRRAIALVCFVALFGLMLVLYQPGFAGPFVLDDVLIFPSTQLVSFDRESVLRALATHQSGIFGRPITILSFILNHQFLGPEPGGYKIINFAIHLFNTVLVFVLVRTLLGSMSDRGMLAASPDRTIATALLVSAFWALHPLQVSTVLYVFQRFAILSATFSLLGLTLFVSGRHALATNGRGLVRLFVLLPLTLALAIGSKESGALLILQIALVELVTFRLAAADARAKLALTVFLIASVLVPLLAGIIYFAARTELILEGYGSRDFTMADRLRTEAVAMMFYLKMILLPNLSDMSFYHDAFPRFRTFTLPVVLSIAVLTAMIVTVVAARRSALILALGIGLFLVSHILESTIIPLELVFEHRNYFAMLGIALPIAWYLTGTGLRAGTVPAGSLAAALMCLLLSGQTVARVTEWSDELTLSAFAFENQPESLRVRMHYITVLWKYGQYEEATQILAATEVKFPDSASLQLFSLAVRCNAGESVEVRLNKTMEFIATRPLDQDVPRLLNLLLRIGSAGDCERPDLRDVSRLVSTAATNENQRMPAAFKTNLMLLHARLSARNGHLDRAAEALKEAHRHSPDSADVLADLTAMQLARGNLDGARRSFTAFATANRLSGNAYESLLNDLRKRLGELESESNREASIEE